MVWLIVVGIWALLAPVLGIPLGMAIHRADSTEQPLTPRATCTAGRALEEAALSNPDVFPRAVAGASAATG